MPSYESKQVLVQKPPQGYRPYQAHKVYVAIMHACGISEDECAKVDGCHNTLWREFVCPDAERHYEKKRTVVAIGCHSRYCPVCTNARVLREVRYILSCLKRWYAAMGCAPLLYELETTLPADLRERVNENNVDGLTSAVYASLCEAFVGLSERALASNAARDSEFRLGAWINFQNWSSEMPLSGRLNPHWHISLLPIKFDKEDKPSLLFDGGCWIGPEQLQRFKEAWTRRATAILGKSSYDKTFVCHVHYANSYGKIRQRLSYQFRYASMDINRVCKDGFYWQPITKAEAERLKRANRGLRFDDPRYSAIGFVKNRYWLATKLEISNVDKIDFLRLVERPKKKRNVRPYGWLGIRSIKDCEKALGLASVKRSTVQSELGKMYCTATVKRAGRVGLAMCGCVLERSNRVFSAEGVKEIGAVILVREKQCFAVLKAWDDSRG